MKLEKIAQISTIIAVIVQLIALTIQIATCINTVKILELVGR